MKLFRLIFLVLFSAIIIVSCDDDDSGVNGIVDEPIESSISFKIKRYPDIGSQETLFKIELTEFSATANFDSLKFRFDFDSDGTFDTEWIDSTEIKFYPASNTSQIMTVEMQELNGNFKILKDTILVGNLSKPFTNSTGHFMMETVWDATSQFIYFTWELQTQYHQIYRGNTLTGAIEKMPLDPNYEFCTHAPKLSPGGNKFLFKIDYAEKLMGIINIETGNIDTVKGLKISAYEWGRNTDEILYKNDSTYPASWDLFNMDTEANIKIVQLSETKKYYAAKFLNLNEICFVRAENIISNGGDLYLDIIDFNTKVITKSYYLGSVDNYISDVGYTGISISSDKRWIFVGSANVLFDMQKTVSYKIGPLQENYCHFENSLSPDGTKIAVAAYRSGIHDPIYYLELPSEIR